MKLLAAFLGILLCLVLLPQRSVEAASKRCTVVRRISGCDYFMVETATDYAVLEWMGGHDPDKDDKLVGDLSTFGFKTFLDDTADDTIHIYVEDYALTKMSALEKLTEKCE